MKNMPRKNADIVLRIKIERGSSYSPEAINLRLLMTVLIVLMDGPNLKTFLVMDIAPIKD